MADTAICEDVTECRKASFFVQAVNIKRATNTTKITPVER
ncbi:Uncharacterized protein dnm_004900 [Desulfonema magnum]|uniref:Uncharacterized protein n=1 Tax=Desulfonema magnum TaxID=45655 RepID=A0A975GL65_9BACT|nr:Uncharacterized protein dnm_004900 [Desulfonema magnum]